MKNLRTIVYASTATHELTTADLELLLIDARTFNRDHHVTGVLLHNGSSFMQCLEGFSEDVDKAYGRVKRSSHLKVLSNTRTARWPSAPSDHGKWVWRNRLSPSFWHCRLPNGQKRANSRTPSSRRLA